MKKERSRFDAIAEELSDPKLEKPEPTAQPATNTMLGTATRFEPEALRRSTFGQPNAYISAMGQAHMVIDWQMSTSMNYDARNVEFFGIEFAVPTHTVELKLRGRVPDLMEADANGDIILVILQGEVEPLYFRLTIKEVKLEANARGMYTTVVANAMQANV